MLNYWADSVQRMHAWTCSGDNSEKAGGIIQNGSRTRQLATHVHDDFEELVSLQLVHLQQGLHSAHRNQVEDGHQGEQGPSQHSRAQVAAAREANVLPQHVL